MSGRGDFENAKVPRAAVLRELPPEPPQTSGPVEDAPTYDDIRDLIREAADKNGGILGQVDGDKLAKQAFPGVGREREGRLVKEVTGNEKPGRKGPRRRIAVYFSLSEEPGSHARRSDR